MAPWTGSTFPDAMPSLVAARQLLNSQLGDGTSSGDLGCPPFKPNEILSAQFGDMAMDGRSICIKLSNIFPMCDCFVAGIE